MTRIRAEAIEADRRRCAQPRYRGRTSNRHRVRANVSPAGAPTARIAMDSLTLWALAGR